MRTDQTRQSERRRLVAVAFLLMGLVASTSAVGQVNHNANPSAPPGPTDNTPKSASSCQSVAYKKKVQKLEAEIESKKARIVKINDMLGRKYKDQDALHKQSEQWESAHPGQRDPFVNRVVTLDTDIQQNEEDRKNIERSEIPALKGELETLAGQC